MATGDARRGGGGGGGSAGGRGGSAGGGSSGGGGRGRTIAIVVVCLVALAGAARYAVVETRKAMQGPATDAERIKQNLTHEIPSAGEGVGLQASIPPAPAAGCAERARPLVDAAIKMLWDRSREAASSLRQALALDPDCVSAGRALLWVESERGTQRSLHRFVERADAEPGNAAAQVMAAHYCDVTGDADGMKRYLERGQAASPSQPLLDAVWGYYDWTFANPSEPGKALAAWQREVELTGDLNALYQIIGKTLEIGDVDRAVEACNRYYAADPESPNAYPLFVCVEAAVRKRDPEIERAYLARFERTPTHPAPCGHGHLAHIYLWAHRPADALAEIDKMAGAPQCAEEFPGVRGVALMQTGHVEEGLAVLRALRDDPSPYVRSERRQTSFYEAVGLALTGDEQGAIALSAPWRERERAGRWRVLAGLLAERMATPEMLRAMLAPKPPPSSPGDPAGSAGCGYIGRMMLDDARAAIDRGLALDGKSPAAWACKLLLLSTEEKHAEAVAEGEKALALGVSSPALDNNLGYSYSRLGRCEKAVPLLERARRELPLSEQTWGNLAECYDKAGRSRDAAMLRRVVPTGLAPVFWWYIAGMVAAVVGLYLGVKLALIKLLPARFGHLRFP